MYVQDNHRKFSFASLFGKKLEAAFDGGILTSDSGVLLLREVASKIGILCRIVEALTDRRHPSYVHHALLDLVKQRVFQIACGYEDANDCNDLRRDPGFKAACDRLPLTGADLASQPTMSRFENRITRRDLYRLVTYIVLFLHPEMPGERVSPMARPGPGGGCGPDWRHGGQDRTPYGL